MRDAIVSVEDKRFWTRPRRRHPRHRPRVGRRRHRRRAPGRLDDRPAVRQERAVRARTTARSSRSCARPRWPTTSTREWPKQKILTEYLNSIYFGNGAYGVESAARVYFGKARFDYDAAERPGARPDAGLRRRRRSCRPCASLLNPAEAALLAGMVANPTRVQPARSHPAGRQGPARPGAPGHARAAGYITRAAVRRSTSTGRCRPRPTSSSPPSRPAAPYFTSWLRPQILAAMGLGRGVSAKRRRVPRLLRRSADSHHASTSRCSRPPSRRSPRTLPSGPGRARAPRWWRSTTGPARSARWSAGPSSTATRTSSSTRSTSPPRATASPARRSSRSPWPWRSSTATAPTRCSTPSRSTSSCPNSARQGALHRPQLRQQLLRADQPRLGHRDRCPTTACLTQLGIPRASGTRRIAADGPRDGDPLARCPPTTR